MSRSPKRVEITAEEWIAEMARLGTPNSTRLSYTNDQGWFTRQELCELWKQAPGTVARRIKAFLSDGTFETATGTRFRTDGRTFSVEVYRARVPREE